MARLQKFRDQLNSRRRAIRGSASNGILFISSGGLGDTVLLSHVMERFMALARPDEPITLILRKDGSKTSFLMPSHIQIETVDFDRLRSDQTYRDETADNFYAANYRMAISLDYLRHPYLDEFLLLSAQASETIAMRAKPWAKYERDLLKNDAQFSRTFDSGPPVYDKLTRWVDFANWLCGTELPVSKAIHPPADSEAIIDTGNTIFIQAFSAVIGKQPLPSIFKEVLNCLPPDCDIRFTGAPGEQERNPDYLEFFDDPRVSYDDSTFEEILPKLKTARLVISVDTAFLHLAIVSGAPTLGLLSAAYVGEIVPYSPDATPDNVRFIYHDMPCRSCLGDCSLPAEDGRFPCIARLSSDEITTVLRAMI